MATRKQLRTIADEVYILPSYGGAKKKFKKYLDTIREYLGEHRFPNEAVYTSALGRLGELVKEVGSFLLDDDEEKHHKEVQRGIRQLILRMLNEHPKIFVVHGRNLDVRNGVTSMLGKLKMDYEVLEDRTNSGATVIEKFLHCAEECDFAIVLMTADDEGGIRGATEKTLRARQNVILELGYFIGRVGRRKIIIMQEDGVQVEWPSDLNGIVRIAYDRGGGWKRSVLKEFEAADVYLHPTYTRAV